MKKHEDLYEDLRKSYSDEELADSLLFSVKLPKSEQREVEEEFLRLRLERMNAMSEEELISSDLFAFKLRLNAYFKKNKFENPLNLNA